jgi:hypothetical protein
MAIPTGFTGDRNFTDTRLPRGGWGGTSTQIERSPNRSAIRQAYNEYLGREASEAEVEGWVSGQYGGGGIDDWLNQIRNSGEAANYQTGQPQRGARDYELSGVPGQQIPGIPVHEGMPGGQPGIPDPEDPGSPPIDPDVKQTQEQKDRDRASGALQQAYREHLGREITDAEIEGWWSGAYGWGDAGIGGLPGWLRGIEQSPEAQGRAGPETETETTGVPPRIGPAPHGWDQTKWADPDHHTTKYDVAAFLYNLTKPSEIAAMVQSPAFQARFPGATFDGKDKIDFGDNLEDGVPVGVIDVLMQADRGGDTSAGLWWGDTGNDPAPGPTGPGPTGPGPTGPGPGPTGPGTDGPWTQPPDSPLFNQPATQGPPSLGYGMGPGGGGGMMGPGGGGGTMGQMITPYNPLATYSPTPYTPPAPFQPPAYQGATPFGQDPYAAATPFTGPTAEDMAADPSYQFRLQQGQEALERSGAARGVTNTGGTLKDILDYGQQAASQEYGNVYGRQRDVYDMNERNRFNAYQANYGNAMDAYNVNERNRAGAFATNVGNARDAYAMNQANRFQGYQTNELARWQENQEAEARRAGAYGTNLGAYERQQQQGLRAQGQGFDQAFRNWQEQYNQGRMNATDTYNRMFGLGTY